jgi:hypothetical protein
MARSMYANVIGRRTSSTNTDFNGLFESLADIRVTVKLAGLSTFATIYDSETTNIAKANPFSTTDGRVEFWAEDGNYDITFEDVTTANRIPARTYRWNPAGYATTQAFSRRRSGSWESNQVSRAPVVYFDWTNETATPDSAYMERLTNTYPPATNGAIRINRAGTYLITASVFTRWVPGQGGGHGVSLVLNNTDGLASSIIAYGATDQDIGHNLAWSGPLAANSLIGITSFSVQTSELRRSRLDITHLGDS